MTIRQSRTLATLEVRAFETIRSAIVNLNVRMIGVQRRSSWTIQLRLRLCAPDMANVSQWSRKIGIRSTLTSASCAHSFNERVRRCNLASLQVDSVN